LIKSFHDKPWWVVKDPRICRLLPLWHELLNELEVNPHFILIVRDPRACVNSLVKRDEMPPVHARLLWTVYNADMIHNTEGYPHTMVQYEQFIADPINVLEKIAFDVAIPLRMENPVALRRISDFIDPTLNHTPALLGLTHKDESNIAGIHSAQSIATDQMRSEATINLLLEYIGNQERREHSHRRQVERSILVSQQVGECILFEVLFPDNGSYSQAFSYHLLLADGEWQQITIPVPSKATLHSHRLRVDPIQTKGVAWISELRICSQRNQESLWEWIPGVNDNDLMIAGDALRLEGETNLCILSTGNDPQIYLPTIENAFNAPLEFHVRIRVEKSLQKCTSFSAHKGISWQMQ
jgi:hypothetical protein